MPVQATAVTRLGIGGGIWNRLGGDYSGKEAGTPADPVEGVPTEAGREGGTYAGYQRSKRNKQRILDDDAEFIKMAQQSLAEILKHL